MSKVKIPPVKRLEKAHPFGFAVVFLAVFLDRKGDIFRAQLFAGGERAARTAAQLANDVAQMFLNDRLAEIFVGEIVVVEKIIVEKMAEGAMADVVQKARRRACTASIKGADGHSSPRTLRSDG